MKRLLERGHQLISDENGYEQKVLTAIAPAGHLDLDSLFFDEGSARVESTPEPRSPTPPPLPATLASPPATTSAGPAKRRFARVVPSSRQPVSAPARAAATVAGPRPTPAPESPEQDKESATPLVGYFEIFEVGEFLGGWAGDPDDPGNPSLRVTLFVDNEEIASSTADYPREDIPYSGFQIRFSDTRVAQLIAEDRLTLSVKRPGGEQFPILPLNEIVERAREIHERTQAKEPQEAPAPVVPRGPDDLSFARIPVGLQSPDGHTIVGRDGFLFLHRGPTNLIEQYRADAANDAGVRRDAAKWFIAMQSRQDVLAKRQIAYVHAVMPDKASVMRDLAPAGLGPVTARLALLEAMVDRVARSSQIASIEYYCSLLDPLRSCLAAGMAPFLRLDTRLRVAGTQLVFYRLIQKMAALMPARAGELAAITDLCEQLDVRKDGVLQSGNLVSSLSFPLYEEEFLPEIRHVEAMAANAEDVPEFLPIPSQTGWRNPAAPSPLKVMAFGSSALGKGDHPRNLSWWFRSMFAEFHASSAGELDVALIDKLGPDIVIGIADEHMMVNPPGH